MTSPHPARSPQGPASPAGPVAAPSPPRGRGDSGCGLCCGAGRFTSHSGVEWCWYCHGLAPSQVWLVEVPAPVLTSTLAQTFAAVRAGQDTMEALARYLGIDWSACQQRLRRLVDNGALEVHDKTETGAYIYRPTAPYRVAA